MQVKSNLLYRILKFGLLKKLYIKKKMKFKNFVLLKKRMCYEKVRFEKKYATKWSKFVGAEKCV